MENDNIQQVYLRHAGPLGTNTEFFTLYEIFAKLCRPTLLVEIYSILLGEKIARVRAGIPDSDHTELLSLNLDLISLQGVRLDRTPFWIGWPTSSDRKKPLSPYILVFTIVSRRDKVWCNTIGIRAPGDLGPEASNSEVDPVIVVTETLFRPPGRLLIGGLVTKHPPASSFPILWWDSGLAVGFTPGGIRPSYQTGSRGGVYFGHSTITTVIYRDLIQ